MAPAFCDTFYWIALINPDDAAHERVAAFDIAPARRLDKGFSLTDCISMQSMRREGLSDVLTNDWHFEQEGFRAVFRIG